MRLALKSLFVLAVLAMSSVHAIAAELVMVDRNGCPWCAKWHAEIGAEKYNATPEGQQAPLRVLNLANPFPPELRHIGGIVGTPTFILVDNGREIDRMEGYPGKQVFFGRIQLMLDKMSGADKKYKTIIIQ